LWLGGECGLFCLCTHILFSSCKKIHTQYAVFALGVVGVVIGEIGEAVAKQAERALIGSTGTTLTAEKAGDITKGAKSAAESTTMEDGARKTLIRGLREALEIAEGSRPAQAKNGTSKTRSAEIYADEEEYTTYDESSGYEYSDDSISV
jgi:hypothetical protein